MTLMEQYGAERRALSFPVRLLRAVAWVAIGVVLFAIAAKVSAEDSAARIEPDPMMEQARRELGRALTERAREFERAEQRRAALSIPVTVPEPLQYPMPLATVTIIQPLVPAALEQAAQKLFDPTPFGNPAALQPGQFSASGRRLGPERPPETSGNVIVADNDPQKLHGRRSGQRNQRSPSHTAPPFAEQRTRVSKSHGFNEAAPRRPQRLLAPPEVTGSVERCQTGRDRVGSQRGCAADCEAPQRAAPAHARSAALAATCVISVRG
jgi:hypothetical protein